MKKFFCTMLLLLSAMAVNAQIDDSSSVVIDRYLRMLNYKQLPRDSMLFMISTQVDRDNPTDTLLLLRWDAFQNKTRAEVAYKGRVLEGYVSDGDKYNAFYDIERKAWRTTTLSQIQDFMVGFEVRGPLYYYRTNGSETRYLGEKKYNGQPIYAVAISAPDAYDREYYFQKDNGMLFLYKEVPTEAIDTVLPGRKVDWRAYGQYQQLGPCLFPQEEVYQADGHVYIVHHEVKFMPVDNRVFDREGVPLEYVKHLLYNLPQEKKKAKKKK